MNDDFNHLPDEGSVPVRGPSGCGNFALGCGIVTAGILSLLGVVLYLAWPGFVAFGISVKLTGYEEIVERTNLDPKTQAELVQDLEKVRLSIDDRNRFKFFQWLNIDKEFKQILIDFHVDQQELARLKSEIGRMKKIQGIEAQ